MTEILLSLIFLAPTIQYRIELPYFSFALMEPVVLIACAILAFRDRAMLRSLRFPRAWPEIGLLALVVWALLIRPWSQDWKHGLSDIRDWVIPVAAFFTLRMTVRQGWRRGIELLVAVVAIIALVGVYQGFSGNFRPFMSPEANLKLTPGSVGTQGVGWDPASGVSVWQFYAEQARLSEQRLLPTNPALGAAESRVAPPFAVGFFAHPNTMGLFLTAGFMLALAWAIERRRLEGWLIPALVGLALFLTYAKTSYVVLVVELGVYFLLRRIRSLGALTATALASVAAVALLLPRIPPLIIGTLAWRYGLWTTAFALLTQSPLVLLFGNGMDAFAKLAYYFQPHNSFVYILLEYGILGLCLLLGILVSVAIDGWRDGVDGHWARNWVLQAVWIATLGFFAFGLTESVLLGIEQRMMFLSFLACYLGLRSELRGVGQASPALSPSSG